MPASSPNADQQAPPSPAAITQHIDRLLACRRCPKMLRPPVAGYPVVSRTLLVGQAPGSHEPVLGRPFAWTAGKTLFKWFREYCGIDEESFRRSVYMAAVCRCFPGPAPGGGDRVPDRTEISNCSTWLAAEFALLRPQLVIPVGKLAIAQFMPPQMLTDIIGRTFAATYAGQSFEIIPLPHPSGASPWPRIEPGKTLLRDALELIRSHPAFPRDETIPRLKELASYRDAGRPEQPAPSRGRRGGCPPGSPARDKPATAP